VRDVPHCSVCGSTLFRRRCLACETRRWARFVHRELILLLVLIGITVAAFFGTRTIAQGNNDLHRRQAAAWFGAAQRALENDSADDAIAALRRAAAKDPSNREYRLALARVLAASRHDDEATRVLLALRDAQPDDPQANLQLARLQARGGDADATRRYYQNALAGLWRREQADARRSLRMELIDFLLAHGERARALAELLVLTADLPPGAPVRAQVGRLFLAAGDAARALDYFVRAIHETPDSAEALAGAGEAAFALGDYTRALRYLNAVTDDEPGVAELREVARLVLSTDPLTPRLGADERRKRLTTGLQQATHRLDVCLNDPDTRETGTLATLRTEVAAFQPALRRSSRRDARDLVEDGVDLEFRIEQAAAQSCPGGGAPLDRALLLIGRRHGLGER
jgi:tetratricopeptide (TPR) repeat protein